LRLARSLNSLARTGNARGDGAPDAEGADRPSEETPVTDHLHPGSVARGLAARISGDVLTAGRRGYDESRTPYFGTRTGHPVAVVRPADAVDVAVVVETAAEAGLPLHVRGGGHHAAGHATGDGLLLDLTSLDGLSVHGTDGAGHVTVSAGAGLTAGEVTEGLAPHGLAVGFGDTDSVGIGGLTLAGGLGFLSRRDGMTIDNLLAAEVVTAEGQIRRVDAEHEPDLFWGLRGGGGNLGVVTRFKYRAVRLTEVYGGVVFVPATARALRRVVAASIAADDELSVITSVIPMPPLDDVPAEQHGRPVLMVRACYSGDVRHGEQAVAQLVAAGEPLAGRFGPMPYPELFALPTRSHGSVIAVRSLFVDGFDTAAAELALEHMASSVAPLRMVQLRALGGAIGRVDPAATAFAHRRRALMVVIASNDVPHMVAARAWTEGLAAKLAPDDAGGYVGFFGPHDGDRTCSAYPAATLARLRQVKATYDPTNLFRHNDNVAPALAGRRTRSQARAGVPGSS
jgi:FAD/FMN-containing dehydrogenase